MQEEFHIIFEPYFTTKHKSQGTGIGLYMSHQIICDHMKSFIHVSNTTFSYKGKSYIGAQFTLKLKLYIEEENDYSI
jgi:two-component system, NtrC family, sensor kinase